MAAKKETTSTEFLIQTLASIQSALSSIDKESTAKTEALNAVLENINSMADMMKHFHDVNTADSAKIVELGGIIKTLEAHLDGADTDLKEIKYAIQEVNKNLLELKIIKQTKEEVEKNQEEEKKEEPKKLNLFGLFKKVLEILSNLKTIAIVVLIIVLLIASLIYGPSVLQTFFEIFKATSGS